MKKLLLLILFLSYTSLSYGAITRPSDTPGNFSGASGSSQTISVTVASDADFLIVAPQAWECAGATPSVVTGPSTVTANGNSMFLAKTESIDTGGNCSQNTSIYYLATPPTGTYDVVVTYPSTMNGIYGSIISFKGVKSTSQPDATNSSTSTWCSNPVNRTITTVADNSLVIDNVQPSSGTLGTPSGGQTQINSNNQSYKVAGSAGSQTMGWAFTGCASGNSVVASFSPTVTTPTYSLILVQSTGD